MNPPLLTKKDLATRLQCQPKTVYSMVARGDGPVAVRVGRFIRFREADVRAWIDSLPDARRV
jgi:excisionase family DNA binding protein